MFSSTVLSLGQCFRLGWLSAKHFTGDEQFSRIFPGELALGAQSLLLASHRSSQRSFIHSWVCILVCADRWVESSLRRASLHVISRLSLLHFCLCVCLSVGFPGASAGKESACNAGDLGLIPGSGRFPWRRERLPTPVFWPREFRGLCHPWGRKELDTTERLSLSLPECGPPRDGMITVVQTQMPTRLMFAPTLSAKVGLFWRRAIFLRASLANKEMFK